MFDIDNRLLRQFEQQLTDCAEPQAEPRATPAMILAASDGLKSLLDQILERRAREEEARRKASAASDVQFSIGGGARFSISGRRPNSDYIAELVARNRTLGKMLVEFVNEKCEGHASWCYRRAGVSRQLYSQIISNPDKHVTKRTVMQLAVGLKLSRAEADKFLAAAGYAFCPTSYEDQVFALCLANRVYNLFDINDLLTKGFCLPIAIN